RRPAGSGRLQRLGAAMGCELRDRRLYHLEGPADSQAEKSSSVRRVVCPAWGLSPGRNRSAPSLISSTLVCFSFPTPSTPPGKVGAGYLQNPAHGETARSDRSLIDIRRRLDRVGLPAER